MAKQELVRSADAFIDPPPTNEGITTEQYLQLLIIWLKKLADKINGGLTLGTMTHGIQAGNIKGQIIEYRFVVQDAAETIPHGLGYKPSFAISLDRDDNSHLYIENHDGWNESEIVLKCNQQAARHFILIW